MKNSLFKSNIILVLSCAVLFLVGCTGCGGNSSNCKEILRLFEGKEITSEILNNYMAATSSQTKLERKFDEEVRIYVDKSSGINEAFSSALGGDKAKSLLLKIASVEKVKYYSVLSEIKQDVFVGSPTNYYDKKQNYDPVETAKLEKALNEITSRNGLSFFVTDAEEFDQNREEDNKRPWAYESMERWIKQGNSIHFWITDFNVKNIDKKEIVKHLFFMAFVPSKTASEDSFQNVVTSLNAINPLHLELSNTSWQIVKPNWSEQSTGLDANLLKNGVFEKNLYIRGFDNSTASYEFMSIQLPIKAEVLTVDGALGKPQFYRDLFLDLSNNKFFDINKLDIDVTEVTNDLNNFAKFDELIKHAPNITKDQGTNKTILDPNDPYTCYYDFLDDKPILKDENKYTKNYENALLKELFQFDDQIFNNSMKDNSSRVELGIKFHKNFNEGDSKLNNDFSYNLIRVDFKIVDCKSKSISELDKFAWDSMYKPSERNTGFAQSVQQVIEATQPKGRIIHTLFIKFIKG
jgi:hypothetical protein